MLPSSTFCGIMRNMSGRKPYHHGDLREALLKASLALLHEPGGSELTLREVARRAGVSHTAPYRHFRDKADLLAAVAEDGFDRLRAGISAAAAKAQRPIERLQNAGIAYIEFAQEHPEHFSVMFGTDLRSDHPSAKAAADRCFGELLALVAGCTDDSRAAQPQRTLALIAWSEVHGIADLSLRGQLRFKGKAEMRTFSRLATLAIVSGLRFVDSETKTPA